MNLRKGLVYRILGWLPKESDLPIHQQTTQQRHGILRFIPLMGGVLSGILSALGVFNPLFSNLNPIGVIVTFSVVYSVLLVFVVLVARRIHRKKTQEMATL